MTKRIQWIDRIVAHAFILTFLAFFILGYEYYANNREYTARLMSDLKTLKDSLNSVRAELEFANNREFRISSLFRSGHDLFIYGRIGNGYPMAYMHITNLEIDAEFVHRVIMICDSAYRAGAPVDVNFALETLFFESRFRVPVGHSESHDSYEWQFNRSTIAHYGWTEEQLEDPMFRLYGFIQYCKDNLYDIPRPDWRKCYRMGRTKYFRQKGL